MGTTLISWGALVAQVKLPSNVVVPSLNLCPESSSSASLTQSYGPWPMCMCCSFHQWLSACYNIQTLARTMSTINLYDVTTLFIVFLANIEIPWLPNNKLSRAKATSLVVTVNNCAAFDPKRPNLKAWQLLIPDKWHIYPTAMVAFVMS